MSKINNNKQGIEIGVSCKYPYAVIKGNMMIGYVAAGALALFGIIGGEIMPNLSNDKTTVTRAVNDYKVSYDVTNNNPRYDFGYAILGMFLGTGAFLGVRRNAKEKIDEFDATAEKRLEAQNTMLLRMSNR